MTDAGLRDSFGCIVLAAGAGTRFGEPKAGARLPSGERFIDVVVGLACEAGAAPIVAVVPPGFEVPPRARPVINPHAQGEQMQSVRLGLAHLASSSAQGVLLWPVDHPLVSLESVLAVVDGFKRTRAPVVLPTYEGRRGHPVFFARETWLDLVAVQDGGARMVVHGYGSRLLEVPVPDGGILKDIDTRADLTPDVRRATDAFS
ncbi:MAG TPA: nucleotidyltransferase family protein [Gemmatimonadaceae bacterium]|nr:nucleotidyltransferase family protein [Gemmatimonadaceae bacterium]